MSSSDAVIFQLIPYADDHLAETRLERGAAAADGHGGGDTSGGIEHRTAHAEKALVGLPVVEGVTALAYGGEFVLKCGGVSYGCLLYTSPSPRDRG